MNPVLSLLANRKSVRAYDNRPVSKEVRSQILDAALRAPTAGNMMLYSIIEVTRQDIKDRLAKTCDDQAFIARAPFVLLFLADYQRWYDTFKSSGVEQMTGRPIRSPGPADLFISCCDTMVAAQNAVIAAESLGVGSCYIGDIMEHYEIHKELFDLPRFVFPLTMLCLGYPTQQQKKRPLTSRYEKAYIVFKDKYRRLDDPALKDMYAGRHSEVFGRRGEINGAVNIGQHMYQKKYTADFQAEMNRSVSLILSSWFDA